MSTKNHLEKNSGKDWILPLRSGWWVESMGGPIHLRSKPYELTVFSVQLKKVIHEHYRTKSQLKKFVRVM
ncbi:hypothetical protein [Paenibacillus guangzhouensis]|uniref:hypothetical protein n=1 Tax=Paenibacillus guangzhouensis TaxID=1473112 RepID=UPI00187B5DA7|nr:hypothetical protein [Paenibacillus guangzhouensis]